MKDSILPRFLSYDPQHPGFGFWAAEEKSSASFLGWFSFRRVDEFGAEVVLGYRLKRTAWGQGYATEGAVALINQGFTNWGVTRVVATTYEENIASRRVLEKAGLTLVRRFRLTAADLLAVDTHHVTDLEIWGGDDLEYALEKSAWLRGQAAS